MINIILRIINSGYSLFKEEKIVTIVNIGTTILISFFIWIGILSFYFFNQMMVFLQERLDFSIYFKKDVNRDEIVKVQKILANFPEVNEVQLVTQEEALQKFQKEVKTNPIIFRALTQLKTNPLTDYLIVKADNPEIYSKIANYLEKSPFRVNIDYTTYFENKEIIQKSVTLSNKLKVLVSFLLLIISIFSGLIIFNSILLSVYSQKENIEILRLIGASNWFIRMPFFFYVFLFSFIGYIISLMFLILVLENTNSFWQGILSNFKPTTFIYDNFIYLNGIILLVLIGINFISTFLALEKYLKI